MKTWNQPDPFPWIASTGFTSPHHEPKSPSAIGNRCGKMHWYNDEKGFGFTECNVFVHARNVVSGELRSGAKIKFDVTEGAKGPQATNIQVLR
ncbi:cold-shock protein [Brevibacillus porteri]|uniref:cold-shock protein n=1 Tax=Brevibacillus porteri TaxID=2126350 RepID=UPI003D1F0594